ncbi:hypothetical protein OROMI_008343 [Orobanche minor]
MYSRLCEGQGYTTCNDCFDICKIFRLLSKRECETGL